MKWDKVTTDKSGYVLFWNEKKIVYIVSYRCVCCDRIYGNIGGGRGFSEGDGITDSCEFCG